MSFGMVAAAAGASAATVAGVTAAASAAIGVYSAYEGKKEADAAYAASQAAFSNDVQAAITNAEWAKWDKFVKNNSDLVNAQDKYNAYIDQLWDSNIAKLGYQDATRQIEQLMISDMTSIQLGDLQAKTGNEIAKINELARLDAEHAVETARITNDKTLRDAAIQAVKYASTTNAAVQFLDSDIDTMKQTINRIKETTDITTKEAIGREILKTGDTVSAGASVSRRLSNAYIKADILANAQIGEQEDAIDKAYSTQRRTATEAQAQIKADVDRANLTTLTNVAQTLANIDKNFKDTKVTTDTMIQNLENDITVAEAIRDKRIQESKDKGAEERAYELEMASVAATNATEQYNIDRAYMDDIHGQTTHNLNRGLEQSILTYITQVDGKEGTQKLLQFYNDNPTYLAEAQERGYLQARPSMFTDSIVRGEVSAENVKNLFTSLGMGDEYSKAISESVNTVTVAQEGTTTPGGTVIGFDTETNKYIWSDPVDVTQYLEPVEDGLGYKDIPTADEMTPTNYTNFDNLMSTYFTGILEETDLTEQTNWLRPHYDEAIAEGGTEAEAAIKVANIVSEEVQDMYSKGQGSEGLWSKIRGKTQQELFGTGTDAIVLNQFEGGMKPSWSDYQLYKKEAGDDALMRHEWELTI